VSSLNKKISGIGFEYRIAAAYLILGGIWIIFSDRILHFFIKDSDTLTDFQTYKGWFYVIITAILFFFFLRKHLLHLRKTEKELAQHKDNLLELVEEKTKDLNEAVKKLSLINEELQQKNDLINKQNIELKETLQQLKDTQIQLFHAEKMASLGIMTAGIAHEINNPLNYILGGVTGLEHYLDDEKKDQQKIDFFIESIKTGVDRVSTIVSGLNQLSRINDNYDEKCTIHEILDNCLSIINHQLKGRIEVIKKYSEEELITLGNVGQLHQVFTNILVNAVQAIEDEGKISINTIHKNKNIIIEITDTGCGIAPENLSKITDPFFTTKDPGKGTGLGLSIAYNLMQAHHGKIRFQSEPEKGTTVTLELPIKSEADVEAKDTLR